MNTLLVTGGAGFIGSNFIDHIFRTQKNIRIVCVDNLDPTYNVEFKKDNLKTFSNNSNFVFYEADICDTLALKNIFNKEKINSIVHLAAKADTRKSINFPYEYERVNIFGTLNLLELSKKHGIKKFVFISTSSVYGNNAVTPFVETEGTDCPLTPYGATKKAGEILAYTYSHNFNLPVICLRIFNAYGERNRPDLVLYKWVDNILNKKPIEISGDGVRERDFTYVGDIVRAIDLALGATISYEVINIGNSKPISLSDLLIIVENVIGQKADVVKRDSHSASAERTYADIKKAKKILDWEAQISPEKGIELFVDWFKKYRFKENI